MKSAPLLGWPILGSIGVHVVGIAAASSMMLASASTSTMPLVPIELVRVEPPAPPPPPPPPKPDLKPITPPKLATKPQELVTPEPLPAVPLREEPLREDTPRRPAAAIVDSSPVPDQRLLGSLGSTTPLAGAVGAGKVFDKGDMLAVPGNGSNGGNASGTGTRVASLPNQGADDGGEVTDFARPLGGYQTKPRYPDGARRRGIEGVTMLRFQVSTAGRVASVTVAQSAGNSDLDRAAVEAVKSWLFEPARRGKEPVSVWVTLPVRFQLQGVE
jgi:periplasmic protein TonB